MQKQDIEVVDKYFGHQLKLDKQNQATVLHLQIRLRIMNWPGHL